jgi:hypothetical protein
MLRDGLTTSTSEVAARVCDGNGTDTHPKIFGNHCSLPLSYQNNGNIFNGWSGSDGIAGVPRPD